MRATMTLRSFPLIALVLGVALSSTGAEPVKEAAKGSNAAKPEDGAAKVGPTAQQVGKLALAQELIRYGRKQQSVEALLTAAQILQSTPAQALAEKPKSEALPQDPAKGGAPSKTAEEVTPKSLLAEAKALAAKSPQLTAVVELAQKELENADVPRGATGGPKFAVHLVNPRAVDSFVLKFNAMELAVVEVTGDGDTALNVGVFDELGNLIASTQGGGDRCRVTWVPKWSGAFVIKVVNHGIVANRYQIATN